jgi:hypothetical protein
LVNRAPVSYAADPGRCRSDQICRCLSHVRRGETEDDEIFAVVEGDEERDRTAQNLRQDSPIFAKFLMKNPVKFSLAPLSGILPLACPLTLEDIPDNSRAIHQFDKLSEIFCLVLTKGPSTCVRNRVRIAVRFRARLAAKGLKVFILYHTPITTVCKHISDKIDPKFDCNPPLTPNRTPNHTPIRTQIRMCRRPLRKRHACQTVVSNTCCECDQCCLMFYFSLTHEFN